MKKIYFNPSKRMTACRIMNIPTVTDRLLKNNLVGAAAAAPYKKLFTKNTRGFDGLAICHEKDLFNDKVGRNLASSRADRAYHKAMLKDIQTVREALLDEIEKLNDLERHEIEVIKKSGNLIERLRNLK